MSAADIDFAKVQNLGGDGETEDAMRATLDEKRKNMKKFKRDLENKAKVSSTLHASFVSSISQQSTIIPNLSMRLK